MFFKSFDRDASTLKVGSRLQRRAAALAVAAAAAVPTVVWIPSVAYGLNEVDQALVLLADQARPTDPQLLASGTEQYEKGQYEEAQATLQQVKAEGLPEADRAKLTETLRKVEAALTERKAARAQFELGEGALAEKDYEQALKYYRAAAENKFADEATRTKAAAQISVVEASQKTTKQDNRSVYRQAVADYREGRLEEAKAKFQRLEEAGYRGGLFARKPASYLRSIEQQLAEAREAPAPAPDVATAPAAPTTQPAVVAAPEPGARTGKQAYDEGVAAYRRGDYEQAKAAFLEAQAANFRPGIFRDPPARYLRMIEARQQQAAADVAVAPAAPPTTAPAEVLSPAQLELLEQARLAKLRQQQRQFEAQQLVEKAQQAQRDNRLADAYTLYAQAAALDPDNRAAAEGKAQTELAVTGAGARPLIEREPERIRLHKQIITYSFERAIADAAAAVQAGNFAAAREALDAAVVAKESNPGIFSNAELAQFERAIANTRMELAQAQATAAGVAQRTVAEETARAMAERARIEAEERRKTVQSLIRTAQQLNYDGQYQQALAVINQILAVDPTNDYAVGVKQIVQDAALIQEQRRIREKVEYEARKQFNDAEERKIPYLDIMRYPTNWPDISDMRDRMMAEERGGGEAIDAVSVMNRNLPEIRFEQAPLAEVVDFLRDVSDANIYVDWPKLENAGVMRTTPVTAIFRNVRFSQALSKVLTYASGAGTKLGYGLDDGIITISTADDLNSRVTTQVHDIRDLLVIAPDFEEPPDFSPKPDSTRRESRGALPGSMYGPAGTSRPDSASGRYGISNPGPVSGGPVNSSGTIQGGNQRTQDLLEQYASIIKSTIAPDSWVDNGGKFGTLKYLQGQLIVTQTEQNQRELVSLLDKLRETRAIQVSIETRFLTVQRNFMEDIGVDIDFIFNINDPVNFSPIVVSQSSSTFTQGPQTPAPDTLGSSVQPAVTIQGSFLDDFQANFLIRATQAARNTAIVNAPRVTVFNGQSAFVIVAQEQAYVADLEAVTGEGVGLYNPIPDVTASGVRLIVQPTVSADRKYVTLSLQPTITQLVSLLPFPVFGIADPTFNNGNGNGNGGGTPGQPTVFTANIQLPIINVTAVNTIVSIPDGGTLLLGGQTIAGEVEIEEGVPILSKIPFIKRLFTNKSTAKDERILLILCKPTIIIHREIEQQQFPLLTTRQ